MTDTDLSPELLALVGKCFRGVSGETFKCKKVDRNDVHLKSLDNPRSPMKLVSSRAIGRIFFEITEVP